MATNKTRLAMYDHSGGTPVSSQFQIEFDIYQDAIDYVETFIQNATDFFGATGFAIYVFSYDNTSYRYYTAEGTVTKATVAFPSLIS